MDIQKKSTLIGIWVCLALALLLTQAAGAGALQTPANDGQDAAVTPPPPAREGDVDRAPQPSEDLAHLQEGSPVWSPEFSPPGANPPGMSASGEYLTPSQTTEDCPIIENFNTTIPDGSEIIAGVWTIKFDPVYFYPYLSTTGEPEKSASFALPGRYDSFSFEADMRRSGCPTCANSLYIRGTPLPLDDTKHWYEGYLFQYTMVGTFSVYKGVAGEDTTLKGWTSSSAINGGEAWNALRVEANSTRLAFYINNTKVWEGTDTSLGYGRVGFAMYRTTSDIDEELRVSSARLCLRGNRSYLPRVLQP